MEIKMIRGAQKRIVLLKIDDSGIFEEALFVLRKDGKATESDERDMVAEAARIIEKNGIVGKGKAAAVFRRFLFASVCFFGGSAVGAAVVSAIFLLS